MDKARAMSQAKNAGALPLSKNVQTGSDASVTYWRREVVKLASHLSRSCRRVKDRRDVGEDARLKDWIKHAQAHKHVDGERSGILARVE